MEPLHQSNPKAIFLAVQHNLLCQIGIWFLLAGSFNWVGMFLDDGYDGLKSFSITTIKTYSKENGIFNYKERGIIV